MIGTGLTMVDVVLSLDEAAIAGRIVAAVAARADPAGPCRSRCRRRSTLDEVPQGSLIAAVALAADGAARRSAGGPRWTACGRTARRCGRRLSDAEQRRFLRHARPWWDVHRHRIAPEVAGRIRRLVQLGQAGDCRRPGHRHVGRGRQARRRASNGAARRRRRTISKFALAVNCTGPLGSISESKDPLLEGLFEAGLAKPDALDLGLEVDGRSRIAGARAGLGAGPADQGQILGNHRGSRYQGAGGDGRRRYRRGIGMPID